MDPVEVVEAKLTDKAIVRNLMQLYLYDFSELDGWDVDEHGLFGYRYLDHYWTEPERHPFLFRAGGHWAGFALVRAGQPNQMAEFFVLRRFRRTGVGVAAAEDLFGRFPGAWSVTQIRANPGARAFWHRAIPEPFEDRETAMGWVQTFVSSP